MSDTEALPELPEPSGVIIVGTQALRAFTADQMSEFGNQQFNAGREFERERRAALAQPAETDADIDEAKIARLHERGAAAWAGVDAADLRAGGDGKPAASGEPVARMLVWHGPKHYNTPPPAARTYAEFPEKEAGPENPDAYWHNSTPSMPRSQRLRWCRCMRTRCT